MPTHRTHRQPSQGVFAFEPALHIPEEYKYQRAKEAARRRAEYVRSVGATALVRGFVKRTDGLFVPHSGTENSAVVDIPERKIELDIALVGERVREKYNNVEEIVSNLDFKEYFAQRSARHKIRIKYRSFMNESATNAARIALHVARHIGEVSRDIFTFDPSYRLDPDRNTREVRHDVLAYNSVLKYLIDLETFTIAFHEVIGENGKRKWPQLRHTKEYTKRMERAHDFLETFAEDIFVQKVDEAYWSHSSRYQFWVATNSHLEQMDRLQYQVNEPLDTTPPVEAYYAMPDYQ